MKHIFLYPILFAINISLLHATPSSVFWTVCTTDTYSTGTGHIDADNYFTIFNRRGHNSAFPPDIGFELGLLSWKSISFEAGVDYLGGTDNPLFFNIGAGIPEDKLFCHAPSIKLGFFNAGTRCHGQHRTNQNIVDFIIGKSLPNNIGGKLCVGAFSGNRAMGKNRQGFMISYQRSFCATKHCDKKEYFKWVLCADYASGKNTIGGGGLGIYYYFNPDISILTGPVWFNTAKYNGKWKWSVQLDFSFPVFDINKDKPLSK